MKGLPSLERAIAAFSRFPGVGRKSAQRMAFYLLNQGEEAYLALQGALSEMQERIRPCVLCHNLAEEALCAICGDSSRDTTLLCLVEEPSDVWAIERASLYRGRYHVLGGRLNPLAGIAPQHLHFASLEARLQKDPPLEIILATNPTVEGDATAHYAARLVQPYVQRITRLAQGVPTGGELEYLDESTLYQAMMGRRVY
ncbi:MAG: recombination protein RecR [Magnetococcales bacterium]|nr:recombination protein RecR [Magnetococcales bacterium]NGZ27048.1 recombination protein RecR [Magnetococcales bacterium]